jgi:NADPH:quinone reductase-like Zn-dependent oxidoreductase
MDFQVRRDNWHECRLVPSADAELAPGQVLFKVDRFAFTSNNISYAAAGDMLKYWDFFPAEEGWGRIPTMGFGDVIASRHDQVAEGERCFGFFPMSNHLVIEAEAANPHSFSDAAAHRRPTAPVYRQYTRVATDPMYDANTEDQTMLLRGLFMTSFLVDDFVADADFFGAQQFVIGSASSKTGLALAFLLAQRGIGKVIGLTSARNRKFVESLGFYDEAVLYPDVESLDAALPTVFVDHSGDGEVVNALHRHFADNLKYSCIVGATHWGAAPRATDLPGATPEFFFAPGQIQKRSQEWGPEGFQERLGGSWQRFRDASEKWLRVVRSCGPEQVEVIYREVLEGRAEPSQGHVLSMWEND